MIGMRKLPTGPWSGVRPAGATRREWLQGALGAAGAVAIPTLSPYGWAQQHTAPAAAPQPSTLDDADDAALFDMERLNFNYFWEQADPGSGLVKDRCNATVTKDTTTVGSIAATGFGLTTWVFLAISMSLRWASAWVIRAALGLASGKLWLLPVRDALDFAVFVASFFGRTVFWRDQLFRVEPSGQMRIDGDQAG